MIDIDYVFPYVNCNDEVWRKVYIDFCNLHQLNDRAKQMEGTRYTDMGLLPTLVNCIKTNMEWIRKIHIIVSNIEQLPEEVIKDERVNVVLHKDIIPSKFLPTFNSTTIEMFIYRIKGLSEKFIYGNDDIFPIGKLKPEDFFINDMIKMNYHKNILKVYDKQFRQVCFNNNATLMKNFGFTGLSSKEYYRPYHSLTPMIKSHCEEVYNKCNTNIEKNLRAFRSRTQHNQYIFSVYEIFMNNCIPTMIRFKYTGMNNDLETIKNFILDDNIDVLCINDDNGTHRNELLENREIIKDTFKQRLNNCK